jgi:hypothetical protein
VIVAVLAGCKAELGADRAHQTDDADPSAPMSCSSNGRFVYLAFEGVTLVQATTDDATQNQAQWLGVATAVVPPFHQMSATRDQEIATITTNVSSILADFPITVVTTRPASGPYVLIAFGGTKATVGTSYGSATGNHDCGDLIKSDVGWVSDTVPTETVATHAVGAIGWVLGLQGTTDPGDCMCGWANGCVRGTSQCTLHGALPTTMSNIPATTCPGMTTQDEHAAFQQAFCQP